MPIRIILAKTALEKDLVFQLRHEVFVGEEGRFASASSRVFDRFDCFDETINFVALDGDTPVAAMRVVLDNPVGLPASEAFDFGAIQEGKTGRWCTCGWLCCLQSYRQRPGIIFGLFKLAVRKIRQAGNRHMIMTIHPPVLKMMSYFGVRAVGEAFTTPELGVPMLPCYVDTDQFTVGAREIFEDPCNLMLNDSDERRIYARDEVVVRADEVGEEAMFVMRGSVRVAPQEGRAELLFGQGHLLGELSLLDGGPRVSTVVAHSHEVDLMVWRRDEFLSQIRDSPDRALAICHLLASRLRRNISGKMINPPPSLLAQVLLDASRRGQQPVSAEWLSRQCGVWLPDLEQMVVGWMAKGAVRLDPEKRLHVTDAEALAQETTV